jgi:oxygen-independent coproporphyrinogen III oxidase
MIDRGLYIHIPFCSGKCYYCDFFSVAIDTEKLDFFTTKIISEIEYFSSQYPDTRISSIYIGGGTPSIVPFAYIERIVKRVRDLFIVKSDEFTIEVNPGEIEWISEYSQLGVNRISLGVQSLDNNVLNNCGRRHSRDSVIRAFEEVNKYYKNLSCDLILGLPGQNATTLLTDINEVSNYVKHISLYFLKIGEGTKFDELINNRVFVLPDDDYLVDTYYLAKNRMFELGFKRYEVSNFARDGFESKHNLSYWRRKEYIGVGPSACSLLGNNRIQISHNNYFKNRLTEYAIEEVLTVEDMAKETVILSLRTDSGLDLKLFENTYKKSIYQMFPEAMEKNYKYFDFSNNNILKLKEEYFLTQNIVFQDFI